MEFNEFKKVFQNNFNNIIKDQNTLFVTEANKDNLWNLYLNSFPEGTNNVYREKREFDCSCCRHFIKSFGNVVIIKNNKLISIWDFNIEDPKYQQVINALSLYVKAFSVCNVFVAKEQIFGIDYNFEKRDDLPFKWYHFQLELPKRFIFDMDKTVGSFQDVFRDNKNGLLRALEEISKESVETTLELILRKKLYKAEECKDILEKFLFVHNEYSNIDEKDKDNYIWIKSVELGTGISRLRNHFFLFSRFDKYVLQWIGPFLLDLSKGVELNNARNKYLKIVDPNNFYHSKPVYSKRMVEDAEKKVSELGYKESISRRFAIPDDIPKNNVLFSNKDVITYIDENDIFGELKKEAIVNPKKFNNIETIEINDFIHNILPKITKIEALFENRLVPNLVSLITSKNKNSKSMFKWNNDLTWAYKNNITDSSMKQQVKLAGGRIEGPLRFSILWNENGDNQNDLDAHCIEPNRNHIFYQNRLPTIHPSSCRLDVDVIHPGNKIAIENMIWTNLNKMLEGKYMLYIHVYSYRNGISGFQAEIEFDGQIYSYSYNKSVKQNDIIKIAQIDYNKKEGFKITHLLKSSMSSNIEWNIRINQFHPVSFFMLSPNHWQEQGIGNKHFFFMLNDCINNENTNGFFNEFLNTELKPHKHVLEALSYKMQVEQSNNQLSGLGFSSTRRNSLICKVEGHSYKKLIKVIF